MRNPLGFFRELLEQPAWIPIWVGALMIINMGSIAFWDETLARWILGVFMASAMLMMGLYSRFGFEKILGVGHFLWIPLLPVVVVAIPSAEAGFQTFLMIWAGATTVSLVFDVRDVRQHFRGGGSPRSVTSARRRSSTS